MDLIADLPALIGFSGLGALVNFASQSNRERFLWGPLALVLAILCLKVARNDSKQRILV